MSTSLAADLKLSVGESLADALTVCDQAFKALDNALNKSRRADLATIAMLQGKLQGGQLRLQTADVNEVPYFGGDLIALAGRSRDKAYALVNDMRLRGLSEVVTDTAAAIGAGAGRTLAETLKPLLPVVYSIAAAILILAVAFFIIQRGKGHA